MCRRMLIEGGDTVRLRYDIERRIVAPFDPKGDYPAFIDDFEKVASSSLTLIFETP